MLLLTFVPSIYHAIKHLPLSYVGGIPLIILWIFLHFFKLLEHVILSIAARYLFHSKIFITGMIVALQLTH